MPAGTDSTGGRIPMTAIFVCTRGYVVAALQIAKFSKEPKREHLQKGPTQIATLEAKHKSFLFLGVGGGLWHLILI